MNAFDVVHDIFSTYYETCTRSGDCATLADAIRRKLELIKRIQIKEENLQTLPKRIREGDIIIMRVPTIFAHFHYLTMIYEHKKLFVFQHFGSYRIPILVHDMSFIQHIQDYVRILHHPSHNPSDEEIGQLLRYESTLYGLTTAQLDELLDAQFVPELSHVEERCQQYDPPPRPFREKIKNILESLESWKDHMIIDSYAYSSPHLSLTQWLEEYSESILLQVLPLLETMGVREKRERKEQIEREDIHNYILEKLTVIMSDLYHEEGREKMKIHLVRILFYKNAIDQREIMEIIRYHIKRPTVSSRYKSNRPYKK